MLLATGLGVLKRYLIEFLARQEVRAEDALAVVKLELILRVPVPLDQHLRVDLARILEDRFELLRLKVERRHGLVFPQS